MPRPIFRTITLIVALMIGGVSWATQALQPQTSDQFSVSVKVTPNTLQGDVWEFDVAFDTHSQDLSDDLLKTAMLVAADGSGVAPIEWQSDPPGGHHRKGVLRFKALKPAPATLELRIQRPGEATPRIFQWALK